MQQCYEEGQSVPHYLSTVEGYYRRIYFEVLDFILAAIKDRFQQKSFQMLEKLELMQKKRPANSNLVNSMKMT